MGTKDSYGLASWMEGIVKDFIRSDENTLANAANEPAWGKPLIGFCEGHDPLWKELKSMIGPFYWEPVDIFRLTFPDLVVSPPELTVISWILPQTNATKTENSKETHYGSERWVRARKFGEEVNVKLRNHVVRMLMNAGFEAVAPSNSPLFKGQMSEAYGHASVWSERHAAYMAGLGTFGLCDGLITPVGKAMRCGSVIARVSVPSSKRPYTNHHEYCLFYAKGTCGACIKRCPVDAISKEGGHDKKKCREYLEGPIARHARDAYGIEAYGCGLCQTKVPCQSGIPAKGKNG
jgi:epoxyqueuosine reductase